MGPDIEIASVSWNEVVQTPSNTITQGHSNEIEEPTSEGPRQGPFSIQWIGLGRQADVAEPPFQK